LASVKAQTDEQLAIAAQRGCRASFETIVERMQGPLLGYLQRLSASREDAEDLVQDTFVRAYRKIDRYHENWRLSTWLFTIARRLCINRRRQQQRARQKIADSTGDMKWLEHSRDPAAALIAAEERQQLWQIASALLSEPELTALWLFYVEDMPVAEIGRVLKRSTAGVKSVMFRARRRLLPAFEAAFTKPTVATAAARTIRERRNAPQIETVY
jgi:RNA polymerase sigma-70 factor (ECF subfamily)